MAVEEMTDGRPDGSRMGQTSSDKIAFFGATPVVQQTAATAVATTSSTASSPFGFTTSTQADALITAVNQFITNQANLGLDA